MYVLGGDVVVVVAEGVGEIGVVDGRVRSDASLDYGRGGNRGDSGCRGRSGDLLSHVVDGEVGGSHAEPEGVRDVVDGLDDAVGVHVAVGTADHTVGRLDLGLGAVRRLVAVVVLANIVLGVVLVAGGGSGSGDIVGVVTGIGGGGGVRGGEGGGPLDQEEDGQGLKLEA